MSTMKAYRFQLRCKPAQERALRRFAGGLRWVWNQALAQQRERHERGEKFAGYAQMCTWLTAWRPGPLGPGGCQWDELSEESRQMLLELVSDTDVVLPGDVYRERRRLTSSRP